MGVGNVKMSQDRISGRALGATYLKIMLSFTQRHELFLSPENIVIGKTAIELA